VNKTSQVGINFLHRWVSLTHLRSNGTRKYSASKFSYFDKLSSSPEMVIMHEGKFGDFSCRGFQARAGSDCMLPVNSATRALMRATLDSIAVGG